VKPQAVLLSRLEVEQYIVELPPMSEERAEAALRYRLDSLYPGDRETARIDYVRNGAKGRGYLLFAVEESALEACRAEAKGRALLSSSLVALELSPRGASSILFWTASWASLDLFESGALIESRRIPRGAAPEDDLRRLLPMQAGEGRRTTLVLASDTEGDRALVEKALDELGVKDRRTLALADALSRVRLSRASVFPLRPRSRRARAFALAVGLCLDLLLAVLLAARYASGREAELARLREEYLRLQRKNGEALRLVDEIAAKERRYEILSADEVPDMYAAVASLASGAGRGCRILSLVFKEGDFRMEAEGVDALTSLAALEASGDFEAVKLHESSPGAGGLARFAISGRFRSGAGNPSR
jgi:hypothetical protein